MKCSRLFCLSHFVALIWTHYVYAFHLLSRVFADICLSKCVQLFLWHLTNCCWFHSRQLALYRPDRVMNLLRTICQLSVLTPRSHSRHLWRPPTLDWGAPRPPCPRPASSDQPRPPPARPRQPRSWARLTRTATVSVTSRTRCPNIYPKIRLVRPQCRRPPPAPSWGSSTPGGRLWRPHTRALETRRYCAEATAASGPPSLCLWSPAASIWTLSILRIRPLASILASLCREPAFTASTTEASPGTRGLRNSGDI